MASEPISPSGSSQDNPMLVNGNGHQNGATSGPALNGASSAPSQEMEVFPSSPVASLATIAPPNMPMGGGADYGEDAEQSGFSRVLQAVMRRWPYALAMMALVTGAGTYYAIRTPDVYRATATIEATMPSRGSQPSSNVPALDEMLGGSQSQSVQTQVAKLSSPWVAKAAKNAVSPKSRQLIDQGSLVDTSVSLEQGTNLISVNVSAHQPEVAAEMATQICKQYIVQSLQRNREVMQGSLKYAKDQLDSVQERLIKAQDELKNYKVRNGTMDLQTETQQTIGRLADSQTQLQTVRADKAASLAEIAKLQAIYNSTPESREVASGRSRRAQYQALIAQRQQLNSRLEQLQQTYTDNYPEVIQVKGQLRDLERRIAVEPQTEISDWRRVENPVRAQIAQDLVKLQSDVQGAQEREKSLQNVVKVISGRLEQLPQKELGMTRLMSEVQSLQDAYQNLSNQYQVLRISEEAKIADARLANDAEVPLRPIAPQRSRIIIYALVVGLLCGIGLTLVLDALDNRIRDESDAKRVINLPILASVPLVKVSQHDMILSEDKPSILLEHYRMLRTNIAFSAIDGPIKSVVVTSSVPNEGKSTCAANLAIAAALSGEKVILVDCDLRRPTVHKMLNLHDGIGLSNVVMGTATLEEALQETSIPGLRVLTAGPATPNLFKLISSATMRSVLQRLADQEDFVVFDTPPALGLADARVISVVADATLLVVSCNEATRQAIAHTRDLLAQSGTHLIGILLNKVAVASTTYGYYHYYSSYLDRSEGSEQLPAIEASKPRGKSTRG